MNHNSMNHNTDNKKHRKKSWPGGDGTGTGTVNRIEKKEIFIDVEQESNLVQYTDNHFIHQMNIDMEKIRNMSPHELNEENLKKVDSFSYKRDSNSPITISRGNSNSNSDNDEDDDELANIHKPKFRKLTYQEVEKSFEISDSPVKYSNELDILITYLKGQKNLYIQSKNITEQKLNLLMIPSLLITSAITLFAPFITKYEWCGALISCMNAAITLLISLVNYFKLESSRQMFFHLANQYDKLETSLEMTNSRLMFIENETDQTQLIMTKIREFEEKICEIKDSTNVFIPEEMKQLFPIICHINIFSFIKKVESYKKNLIVKYRDIKNEIRYIYHKTDELNHSEREKNRVEYLTNMKEQFKNEIIQYKNAYCHIDNIFIKEIQNAENMKKILLWILFFGVTQTFEHDDPILKKYMGT